MTPVTTEEAITHLFAIFSTDGSFIFNGQIRKALGGVQIKGFFKGMCGAGINAQRAMTALVLHGFNGLELQRGCGQYLGEVKI